MSDPLVRHVAWAVALALVAVVAAACYLAGSHVWTPLEALIVVGAALVALVGQAVALVVYSHPYHAHVVVAGAGPPAVGSTAVPPAAPATTTGPPIAMPGH
jgi:hypothetical protein